MLMQYIDNVCREGAIEIGAALRTNSALTYLHLGGEYQTHIAFFLNLALTLLLGNGLLFQEISAFASALMKNKTLKHLDLQGNTHFLEVNFAQLTLTNYLYYRQFYLSCGGYGDGRNAFQQLHSHIS